MNCLRLLKLVMLSFLLSLNANAQPLQNQENAREYFAENIQNLDPIEGIYDVENTIEIYSAYAGKECIKQHFVCVILKGSDCYFVQSVEGDLKGLVGCVERMSSPTSYSFEKVDGNGNMEKIFFELVDKYSFELKSEKSNRTAKSRVKTKFIKKYPTASMYADAVRKQVEEAIPTEWTGTGFALNNGYLVTNYHVIENAKSISIQGIKGDFDPKYSATIIATDKYNDLALLQISDKKFNGFGSIPYNVKTSVSEVGEDVFVLGYPLTSTMGDEIKLTTGVISSKTGFQGDVSLYQISAPIQPGNSGGPLFDNKGNLIGIVNAKHKGAENVGYAIKTSYLRNLIESSLSSSILPNNNQIAGLPLTGKVKSLKNYVFMITCSNVDGNSTYSVSPLMSNNIKTIDFPTVQRTTTERARIKSVKLAKDYTAIEIISNNQSRNGYYQWCNIDRNTYILVNGTRYTLTRTDGIEIAPQRTYYSYAGQDITFTLYFPPISDNATSIDLIESADSEWKFYGIKIK